MSTLRNALLRRSREIISDPACWTPSPAARDELRRTVSPRSTDARMFSGLGALTRAAYERGLSDSWLFDIVKPPTMKEVIQANDKGHAAVLACLERLQNNA
jgi:hypothetical protein